MYYKEIWDSIRKNKPALISLYFLVLISVVAILAPFLSPYDPAKIDYSLKGEISPPSWKHPFGVDNYGRDILSRCIYGSRITLLVGVCAVLIFVVIGTILGAISGYFGGIVDVIIMRTVDVLLSLPLLYFIMVLQIILSPSIWNVILVIGLTGWAPTCRLIRGQVLSIKNMPFVESAKAVGAGNFYIIFRHIIPNVLGPVMVNSTLGVAGTILLESALSFLGFGVQEPLASWGSMLYRGQNFITVAPWMVIFPGLLIVATVLSFNFIGDAIKESVDPRLKKR